LGASKRPGNDKSPDTVGGLYLCGSEIDMRSEAQWILSISNIIFLYSEIVPTSSSYNELLPSNPKKQKSPTVFYSFINGWGF